MDGDPRREVIQPMTLDELQNLRSLACDDIHNGENNDFNEFKRRSHERVEKLIRDLLQMSHRFKYVFLTESGSMYFVLDGGQCLRIKKDKSDKELWSYSSIQPITGRTYFVSEEEGKKAKYLNRIGSSWKRSFDRLIGEKYGGDRTVKYSPQIAEELSPLEINLAHDKMGLAISDDGNAFEIVGEMENGVKVEGGDDENAFLTGAMHLGHNITKIIKS